MVKPKKADIEAKIAPVESATKLTFAGFLENQVQVKTEEIVIKKKMKSNFASFMDNEASFAIKEYTDAPLQTSKEKSIDLNTPRWTMGENE